MGLDLAELQAWIASSEEDDDEANGAGQDDSEDSGVEFLVWPENWTAVQLFVRCDTQWVWTMGACLGLDYARVEAVMRISGIPRRRQSELLDEIRIMERAALPLINRKST